MRQYLFIEQKTFSFWSMVEFITSSSVFRGVLIPFSTFLYDIIFPNIGIIYSTELSITITYGYSITCDFVQALCHILRMPPFRLYVTVNKNANVIYKKRHISLHFSTTQSTAWTFIYILHGPNKQSLYQNNSILSSHNYHNKRTHCKIVHSQCPFLTISPFHSSYMLFP